MIRPIQHYGTITVTPIAPSADAYTQRDVVSVQWEDRPSVWLSRSFRGEDAYVRACETARTLEGRVAA